MKGTAIYPLSQVSRQAVERYLLRRGSRPEMIAWKYFDARFNRGRERGMVWLQGDEVRGFIGLIPFHVQDTNVVRDAVWTCDWSVEDPQRSPGMGIVLLRAAIDAARCAMALGGNDLTRSLLPRIASQTIADAGVVYVCPLRLGHLLERVDRRIAVRAPGVPSLAKTPLARLPVRRMRAGSRGSLTMERGVSRALEPMLAPPKDGRTSPAYDFEYVDWQCGRCPDIEAWSCVDDAPKRARAAAVVFRARTVPAHWRMVLWLGSDPGSAAADVLRTASAFAHQRAALSLSVIISYLDAPKAALLQTYGFRKERGGHPLYVSVPDRRAFVPFGEVRELSYLDTDLAHLA